MIPRLINLSIKRLLILSDLHLDKAQASTKEKFLKSLQKSDFDAALVTGDISVAVTLVEHLLEILNACDKRPVIMTTGNHDYFGSSFKDVHHASIAFRKTSQPYRNGAGEIIGLSRSTALSATVGGMTA